MNRRQLDDKFILRLPDGMRDRIKAAATVNRRSMNSEIVLHLERVFPAPHETTGVEFGDHAPVVSVSHTAVDAAGSSTHRP
jgi:hypothetical protein